MNEGIGDLSLDDATSEEELLAIGNRVLAAQNFSRHMGVTLDAFSHGEGRFRLKLEEIHLQHHGFVHGGVLGFMADVALTFVGATALRGDAVTSEYKVNYLRPAQGRELIARGHVVSAGRRQAVTRCEISVLTPDGEEKICAAAQGTIVPAH